VKREEDLYNLIQSEPLARPQLNPARGEAELSAIIERHDGLVLVRAKVTTTGGDSSFD
jgi:hypothetical protein